MPRGQVVLHVDRRDACLSACAGVLHVRDPGGGKQALPIAELALVVVNGHAQATAHALRALGEAGVPVLAIGGRQQLAPAWAGPGLTASVRLRHAQHLAHADPQRRLHIARELLQAKFAAQRRVCDVRLDDQALSRALSRLESHLVRCGRLEALRGVEGAAAAAWFSALARRIPPRWGFRHRQRRPPPCPANAMLSYLYAVAGSEVQTAALVAGLDPGIGFLHDVYPGRAAITLDLIEPLRPAVDAIVLSLLGEDTLAPDDFSIDTKGCRMGKHARVALMTRYAHARLDWPGEGLPLEAVCRRHLRMLSDALGHASEESDDAGREP